MNGTKELVERNRKLVAPWFVCLAFWGGLGPLILPVASAQDLYTYYFPAVMLSRQIAFESDRGGNYYHDLYLMEADGSNVIRIDGPDSVLCPAWAPDGLELVYASMMTYDIYTIHSDGTGMTRLTSGSRLESYPSWSPDRKYIAFSATDWTTGGIYAIHTDGYGEVELTASQGSDYWTPQWSPDGKQMAFSSDFEGNTEIYVADVVPTSTAIELKKPFLRVTNDPHWDLFPSWSPDGAFIVFESDRDGDPEIWVTRADGTGTTQLTHNTVGDGDPIWSPDGAHILFMSERDGNFEVYMMDADGSNPTNLTNSPFWEGCPSWLR